MCMAGEVVESRGDATDFKIDALFVQALLMSQVPQRPGRGWDSQPLTNG